MRRFMSASSIHSPQSSIVAYMASYLDVGCTIYVGGRSETLPLQIARNFGAEIVRCPSGRHTVLFSIIQKALVPGDFVVPFGMRPSWPCESFYSTCALQVQNIPSNIDTVVVVAGSGVTATNIAYGLWRYRPTLTNIVLLGVGPDRRKEIVKVLGLLDRQCAHWVHSKNVLQHYPLNQQPGFRYESPVQFHLGRVALHPLYEGKAYEWFLRNVSFSRDRTLFWVTGPPLDSSALASTQSH